MSDVLIVIQVVAGLYVIWKGLMALNRMNSTTPASIRFAYIYLVVGAAASVAGCFKWHDVFETVFVVGVALYFHFIQGSKNVTQPQSVS